MAMGFQTEASDRQMLDYIRQHGAVTIAALVSEMDVTATAVRQRIQRLIAEGLVERQTERKGRGRPNHRYLLTDKGIRSAGNNFADIASVLWEELKSVEDPSVRRGLLRRIAERLVDRYRNQITGSTVEERMKSLANLMGERDIPFLVNGDEKSPMFTALACPYPDLSKGDRGVCTMEKVMFSELLGENLKLIECRLDGGQCCSFKIGEP
jgi:DeoR family transcriptional regulator, suf operon transcriptional repressor